jgi:two-component sensor histidine kinase/DNA-binding response OmpR family regulator
MDPNGKVNVLLVDDQPGKLMSYEVMLEELGENIIKTSSAKEALEVLLKTEIAVILVDVCMPELDGFELAAMIRDHPRFQRISIIFISAIHISEADSLRGYDAGAVDYVPVPIVPEVLRAKVRVFAELFRKTKQLEELNCELESRVAERTAAVKASNDRLLLSEQGRTLALAAGHMGSWEYDFAGGSWRLDDGQYHIFGVDPGSGVPPSDVKSLVHPNDWKTLSAALGAASAANSTLHSEIRVIRPSGEMRWCLVSAAVTFDAGGAPLRVSGVTIDITERKEAEQKQALLAREVDHRARNALAVVQAIVRLSRATDIAGYVAGVEGRIRALALSHDLLSQSRWQGADISRLLGEEMAPYRLDHGERVTLDGPSLLLPPDKAQTVALAVHELATNAAKYGALSGDNGSVEVQWRLHNAQIELIWRETGGPAVSPPTARGFGTRIIEASINPRKGGSADFDWRPEGLCCTIMLAYKLDAGGAVDDAQVDLVPTRPRACRVLVVEDEPLVGMLTSELLDQMGYAVVGPVPSLSQALRAANEFDFEGAVLDVNLGGELVFPLADILSERQIPFVFLTGYEKDVVVNGYRSRPTLQKPIAAEELEAILRTMLNPQRQSGGPQTAPA